MNKKIPMLLLFTSLIFTNNIIASAKTIPPEEIVYFHDLNPVIPENYTNNLPKEIITFGESNLNSINNEKTIINVVLNGKTLTFDELKPLMIDNSTYLPMEGFFKHLAENNMDIDEVIKNQIIYNITTIDGGIYFAASKLRDLTNWKVYWRNEEKAISIVSYNDEELKTFEKYYNKYYEFDENVNEIFSALDLIINKVKYHYETNTTFSDSDIEAMNNINQLNVYVSSIIENINNINPSDNMIITNVKTSLISNYQTIYDIIELISQLAKGNITNEEFILKINEFKTKIFENSYNMSYNMLSMKYILNIQ